LVISGGGDHRDALILFTTVQLKEYGNSRHFLISLGLLSCGLFQLSLIRKRRYEDPGKE